MSSTSTSHIMTELPSSITSKSRPHVSTTTTEPILQPSRSHTSPSSIELGALNNTTEQNATTITDDGPSNAAVTADEETTLSRATAFKLTSAGFSFFFAGINDGALGTLLPYFRDFYRIGLGEVTVIYLTTFLGWLLSGLTNTLLLTYCSPSTILLLGASLQLLSHTLRTLLPPYPLFCFTFFLVATGLGYQDSHANTFVSGVRGAHRWLGFVHAMYAVGLLLAPFVANSLAGTGERGWRWFFVVLVALGVVNVVGVLGAFWEGRGRSGRSGGLEGRRRGRRADEEGEGDAVVVRGTMDKFKHAMKESGRVLKVHGVWQLSLFYFFWLGAAFSTSGYLVEYLLTTRGGTLPSMGYVPIALNGGTLLGRLLLPEPTHRLGERRMILVYSALWLGLQLVFWLVPSIVGDVVAVGFIGFFSGPFFATGISVASKLFDRGNKAAALGFVFIAAQAGGALFPALTGLVAAHAGVRVLQPIVVGLIVAAACSWLLVPKVERHAE